MLGRHTSNARTCSAGLVLTRRDEGSFEDACPTRSIRLFRQSIESLVLIPALACLPLLCGLTMRREQEREVERGDVSRSISFAYVYTDGVQEAGEDAS